MSVPYVLTLPEILGGTTTFPAVEVTGLGSLPIAAAIGAGVWGYNRYNRDMSRLAEREHYSDRNADRLIRNIGQVSRVNTFPSGHIGSPSNPYQLREITVTAPKYGILGSRFYDASDSTSTATPPAPAVPADTTTVAPGTTAPSPQPERNDSTGQGRRPSFRERLGDRIAGRNSRQATSNSGSTPPNNDQNGSFIGRMLWETKNNNFGQNYWQWRNVGRIGLGLSYPAREHLWPAVGSAGKYMIMGPDSIPATPTPTATNTPSAPVDNDYIAKDQYIAPTDTLDF